MKWWRWSDWVFVAVGLIEGAIGVFLWAATGDWGRGLFLIGQCLFLCLLALHIVSQRHHVKKFENARDDLIDSLRRMKEQHD